jgi:hypothetical protein
LLESRDELLGDFTRLRLRPLPQALDRGLLLEAEATARELGSLTLTDALDYCDLLSRLAPER